VEGRWLRVSIWNVDGSNVIWLKKQDRCIQGFGGEAWRKETTWKTYEWMGR
jgi:hypothetical protein